MVARPLQSIERNRNQKRKDTWHPKVAEAYEEEVANAVDALSSLLEPLIIVFVGVVVGGMVIAMYLPIFKLAAVI